jgi:hypothetical protein
MLFEPSEVDRIPLPSQREALFELVCLVRIARGLAGPATSLRWLSRDGHNTLEWRCAHLRCGYQHVIDREAALRSPDFPRPLSKSLRRFNVDIHERFDLLFEFEEPLRGFDGIIVEAKSGNQRFDAAVSQLRTYRAALPASRRYVVWGVVENAAPVSGAVIKEAFDDSGANEDLWLFSSADDLGSVTRALFGAPIPGDG